MKLIALFGGMGSGKDTAAMVLEDYCGYAACSLASPMKKFACDVMGFTEDQCYGPSGSRNAIDPRWGVSPRHVLQTMGSDWMRRMVHEDVWINYALDRLDHWKWDGAVIADVRYENEVRRIKEFGGYVVRVIRPGLPRLAHMSHESELDQLRLPDSLFDAVIVNDGSIEDLHAKMVEFESTVRPVEERR